MAQYTSQPSSFPPPVTDPSNSVAAANPTPDITCGRDHPARTTTPIQAM
ncbi:MAG: hypothetical protein IPL78_15850 [Chloroflexi bacterium]|nr:hypothetical protein [Chloroflexota bacterium]